MEKYPPSAQTRLTRRESQPPWVFSVKNLSRAIIRTSLSYFLGAIESFKEKKNKTEL